MTTLMASPCLLGPSDGFAKIVRLLLEAPGIEVNMTDNNDQAALTAASINGHKEAVRLLLGAAYRDVAIPVAQAMACFVDADYAGAVNGLLGALADLWRMGGSVAHTKAGKDHQWWQ